MDSNIFMSDDTDPVLYGMWNFVKINKDWLIGFDPKWTLLVGFVCIAC